MRNDVFFLRRLFLSCFLSIFIFCYQSNASQMGCNDDSEMVDCYDEFGSGTIQQIDSLVRREIFDLLAANDVRSALNFAATCKQFHKAMTDDVGTGQEMLPISKDKFWKELLINYIGQKSGFYTHFNAFHRKSFEESGLNNESLFQIIQQKVLKGALTSIHSSYFTKSRPRPHHSRQGLLVGLSPDPFIGFLHPNLLQPTLKIPVINQVQRYQDVPVSFLNLSNAGLVVLPRTIGKMTGLRSLDVGNNNLRILPYEIASLPLRELKVFGNRNLTRLPQGLLTCNTLTEIYLDKLTQYDWPSQLLIKALEQKGVIVTHFRSSNQLAAIPEVEGY